MKTKTHKTTLSTFKTFMPIFPGFYNTIWDESDSFIEYETDNETDFRSHYPELDAAPWEAIRANFWDCIDYRPGNLAVAQAALDALPKVLPGFVRDVKFDEMRSPREYNFYNDAVNCEITVDVAKVRAFLRENADEWADWLRRRYSSRDGFISFYPTSADEWKQLTENFSAMDGHYCGAVLEFIASQEHDDPELELYYAANTCEAFSNGIRFDFSRILNNLETSAA
jgi:hypothetical protein